MVQCEQSLTRAAFCSNLGEAAGLAPPAKHVILVHEGRGSLTIPLQLPAPVHAKVKAVGGAGR